MTGEDERAAPYVQSLERGLAVIAAFDADHPELTLAEVSHRTGINRAAVRRFLHTLIALGYVRTDGRLFALTPRVLNLGFAYLSGLRLPDIAEPHLKALSTEVGESTSASVLDGPDVVYVARAATRRIMHVRITVGTRFPAYATSMGRVLLAHLDGPGLESYWQHVDLVPMTARTLTSRAELMPVLQQVRNDGYAVVDQELELGLRSVAAPIRDRVGRVCAAVNVSTSIGLAGDDDPIPGILPHLLATAAAITADLAVAGD